MFAALAVKVVSLETRFDGLETRFDGLETKVNGLETKLDDHADRTAGQLASLAFNLSQTKDVNA